MGYRIDEFTPGEIYHIYTRGVEKRNIFRHNGDRMRFLALLLHCLPQSSIRSYSLAYKLKQEPKRTLSGEGLVDVLCYCLMTNHIHLLLRENTEHGISLYMQRVLNSYARYFNVSAERSGSLFVNPFKAVLVVSDDQFLHVGRYIHLNSYVAHLIKDPFQYRWSSLGEYISKKKDGFCHTELLHSMMKPKEYRKFVADEADYARSLADIEHLLIDGDE